MEQKQFAAIMPYICSDLVAMICNKRGLTGEEAIKELYNSKLYEMLENEETKVWHYSTLMLYSLYEQERATGILEFPDV